MKSGMSTTRSIPTREGIDDPWREYDAETLRDHFPSDEQQRDETRE